MSLRHSALGAPEPQAAPMNVPPVQPSVHDASGAPLVYLTFDDGPHPTWTPRGERSQTIAALGTVLDALTARGYTFGLLCN